MSFNGTAFRIPRKGQAKKGNPFEEGGGEDEGEEWLGRMRTDENKDEGQQQEEGEDKGQQQGTRTDEDKAWGKRQGTTRTQEEGVRE